MENFDFFGKTLLGTPEIQPRWKRGVALVEASLGEAVGKLYVAKHFPPEAKARMEELVANLIEAYREDIQALDWMSRRDQEEGPGEARQVHAQDRLSRQVARLLEAGDPPRRPGRQRPPRADAFEYGPPTRPSSASRSTAEWGMTPQTVNAYYNPSMNEIVFPAAILQPPFFDPKADDAVNYGGIGAVIGHEIGHGFDDQGSKYDGDGNLKNWWTAGRPQGVRQAGQDADRAVQRLRAAAAPRPARQRRAHDRREHRRPGRPDDRLQGLPALAARARRRPVIDGLTGDQRFFIGWAQVWRTKYRDAELSRRLATDPHSPTEFRCNGVVRNLPEFYDAFGVKEGDKLWLPPKERVRIW